MLTQISESRVGTEIKKGRVIGAQYPGKHGILRRVGEGAISSEVDKRKIIVVVNVALEPESLMKESIF